MLSAKDAHELSNRMFIVGGNRKKIYYHILECITHGEHNYTFNDVQTETLNWVLKDLVDIGYKVSRTPRYYGDNKIKDEYVYTIEW